jgi:hypothetical protein
MVGQRKEKEIGEHQGAIATLLRRRDSVDSIRPYARRCCNNWRPSRRCCLAIVAFLISVVARPLVSIVLSIGQLNTIIINTTRMQRL